jgi:hypothetical protein
MKKIFLIITAFVILAACISPRYGHEHHRDHDHEKGGEEYHR